jgi:hypothetical protein
LGARPGNCISPGRLFHLWYLVSRMSLLASQVFSPRLWCRMLCRLLQLA